MRLLARIRNKSFNTLKKRFFAGIAFLLFFGGLFSVLPLLLFVQQQREESAFTDLAEVLHMQNEVVSNRIDELTRDINYLSELPEASYEDKNSFYKKLELLSKNRNTFYGLFYANRSGRVVFNTNRDVKTRKVNIHHTTYFQKAKEWHTYTTGVRLIGEQHLPAVVFSSPITSKEGRFGGILGGIVLVDSMRHVVSDFAYGETGAVYLADKTGKILSASTNQFPKSLKDTAIFQDALARKIRNEPYQNVNGIESIGQYTWLNQEEWVLISEVSTAEVAKPFYETLFFMSIVLLFIFFLSCFAIHRLIRQMTEPIDALLEGTLVLRKGNYQHRIDEQVMANSIKEFRELHDAYNEMASDLEKEHLLREQAEKDMRRTNEKLRRLSLSDGLTGIGNRRYFDEILNLLWGESIAEKKPVSLLLLDIDFFKKYNDRYGHIAGDKALCLVAEAVDCSVKKAGAIAARYGGEELAVIIPPGIPADSYWLAEQIRQAVEQLRLAHEDSPSGVVSVSIGTATVQPSPDKQPHLLIQQADEALYYSKKKGRAQITAFKSLTP